jgi:hypothetical protein
MILRKTTDTRRINANHCDTCGFSRKAFYHQGFPVPFALTSYQEQMLGGREAWQFLKPLKVKILRYDTAASQINVEMKTSGRMQGTTWWLDASAVGQ